MDYAGGEIGTLAEFSSLSPPTHGAVITSAAQLPAPVDYRFLGAPAPTARERWLVERLLGRGRRR